MDLKHSPGKGVVRIGVYGKLDSLPNLQLPNIGLIDLSMHLHFGEVVGDLEQSFGLKTDRDGLARVDVPLDDHPVDGRSDRSSFEIEFRLLDGGLFFRHHRFGVL